MASLGFSLTLKSVKKEARARFVLRCSRKLPPPPSPKAAAADDEPAAAAPPSLASSPIRASSAAASPSSPPANRRRRARCSSSSRSRSESSNRSIHCRTALGSMSTTAKASSYKHSWRWRLGRPTGGKAAAREAAGAAAAEAMETCWAVVVPVCFFVSSSGRPPTPYRTLVGAAIVGSTGRCVPHARTPRMPISVSNTFVLFLSQS